MMTSLLSIFDPSSSIFYNFNWVVVIFMLFLIPLYWVTPSLIETTFFLLKKELYSMFSSKSRVEVIFVSIFMFIFLSNLLGLLPYIFSTTSHFFFNFSLSMVLWLASIMWGLKNNLSNNIAHLTPAGCPLNLVPFMVLVELVSALIRPVTLALRLMSNILAGHLILTLISQGIYSLNLVFSSVMFILHSGFFMFEIGVAFIQAYVFSNLLYLYWLETEHGH